MATECSLPIASGKPRVHLDNAIVIASGFLATLAMTTIMYVLPALHLGQVDAPLWTARLFARYVEPRLAIGPMLRAQLRDLQLVITDGETFVHEERRHTNTTTEPLAPQVLGYRVTNRDPEGRYSVEKTIITDPHYPCLLQRIRISANDDVRHKLKVFVLCAPHLQVGGWHNNACVIDVAGRGVLSAEKNGAWLTIAATRPFVKLSCGYVGQSDGWTDLADNFKLDWEFDRADDGNVALVGEAR